MQKALRTEDLGYILTQAEERASAGADILDVNVGYPGVDEVRMMNLAVSCLRENTDLPLQIDSTDPEVIEAGLRAFPGVAIVNSVNGEQVVLERILPVVKKYGACVVGLTLDENGIPQTAEARVAIAERIVECAEAYGISREKVFIDCLTLTLSAQQEQAKETLRALRIVTEQLGLRTVLGVSNISFGLPARSEMNRAFLLLALENGLSLPIIDPNAAEMTNAVRAYRAIRGLIRMPRNTSPGCLPGQSLLPQEEAPRLCLKRRQRRGTRTVRKRWPQQWRMAGRIGRRPQPRRWFGIWMAWI